MRSGTTMKDEDEKVVMDVCENANTELIISQSDDSRSIYHQMGTFNHSTLYVPITLLYLLLEELCDRR